MSEAHAEIQEVPSPRQQEITVQPEIPLTLDSLVQIGRALALLSAEELPQPARVEAFFDRLTQTSLAALGVNSRNLDDPNLIALMEVIKKPAKGKEEKEIRAAQLKAAFAAFPPTDILSDDKPIDGEKFVEQIQRFFVLDANVTEKGGLLSMLTLNNQIEKLLGSNGFEIFAKGTGLSEDILRLLNKRELQTLFGVTSQVYDREEASLFTSQELIFLSPTLAAMKELQADGEITEQWLRTLGKTKLFGRLGATDVEGSSMDELMKGWKDVGKTEQKEEEGPKKKSKKDEQTVQADYEERLKRTQEKLDTYYFSLLGQKVRKTSTAATPEGAAEEEKIIAGLQRNIVELQKLLGIQNTMAEARKYLNARYSFAQMDMVSFELMLRNNELKFPFVAGLMLVPSREGVTNSGTVKVVTGYDATTNSVTCMYCDQETADRLLAGQELTTKHYTRTREGFSHLDGDDNEKANILEIELGALKSIQVPLAKPEVTGIYDNAWHAENRVTHFKHWDPIPLDGLMQQFSAKFQKYLQPEQQEEERQTEHVA